MTTDNDVLQAMRHALAHPGDEAAYNGANNVLLQRLFETQADPKGAADLEKACSTSADLAFLYYQIIDNYLSSCPSITGDDAWVKLSGVSFLFEEVDEYAPCVELTDIERQAIAEKLKARAKFPGEIQVATFGIMLPVGDFDFPPLCFLMGMEESIGKPSSPRVHKTPLGSAAQLIVGVRIVLPFHLAPAIDRWEGFDMEWGHAVEDADMSEFDIRVSGISKKPGTWIGGDSLVFEMGHALMRPTQDSFDDLVMKGFGDASPKPTEPTVEFVLTDSDEEAILGAKGTSIAARIKDGQTVLAEAAFFGTNVPAFVLGYWQALVQDILYPGCAIRVVDLRGQLVADKPAPGQYLH